MKCHQTALKPGCVLSPLFSKFTLDETVTSCRGNMKQYRVGYWKVQRILISELVYEEDMVVLKAKSGSTEKLKDILHRITSTKHLSLSSYVSLYV